MTVFISSLEVDGFRALADLKIEGLGKVNLVTGKNNSGKCIDIKLNLADAIHPLRVDRDRMSQCLLNLYLNGIQAMPDGGTLTIGFVADDSGYARITVTDTGKGIMPEEVDKIFDPYFTTKKSGTGLGLAIVYKIVEAHQGQIEVKSTPGRGTRFTLKFPCPEK